jgi:hypothetical protein
MHTDVRRTAIPASTPAPDTQPMFSPAATLDAWTTRDWSEALDLTALTGLAAIEVVTRRSIYHVVPTGEGEVRVRGGRYLPTFQRARAIGCSMGGAVLKQHAIHVGFRMEIAFEDMRLVTSEVVHIRVLPDQHA